MVDVKIIKYPKIKHDAGEGEELIMLIYQAPILLKINEINIAK